MFLMSLCFHPAVGVLCISLELPCVGQQCVIVAFPGDTHVLGENTQAPTL